VQHGLISPRFSLRRPSESGAFRRRGWIKNPPRANWLIHTAWPPYALHAAIPATKCRVFQAIASVGAREPVARARRTCVGTALVCPSEHDLRAPSGRSKCCCRSVQGKAHRSTEIADQSLSSSCASITGAVIGHGPIPPPPRSGSRIR